jgi:isopentenyldiphosphate isomerase
MPAADLEMVIDAVDRTDTPVGRITRALVFREHVNFRVSHVLIFNSKGELLLQQLAFTRNRNPGAWGSSVASYLFSAEGYLDAARRRVHEELGISGFSLVTLGKTQMLDDGCLKFITVFQSLHEGPFHFDRSLINQVKFMKLKDIEGAMRDGSMIFTPTFRRVLEYYLSSRNQR